MRRIIYMLALVAAVAGVWPAGASASTRRERQLVSKGNKLYTQRKFAEAESCYTEALKENPRSVSAVYNLGLSQLRQVSNPADTTAVGKARLDKARRNLDNAAKHVKDRPGIAAKANYNLGNLEFNAREYGKAIEYYKQSLRIDPDDERTRRNLRIAQLQQQKQNQDKNKDQDKKDQDKKDQDKKDRDKNQDKNQEQNKDQNRDKQQQQQPEDRQINEQTADRILKAMDNKENQTRARVNRANTGQKSSGQGRAVKRW